MLAGLWRHRDIVNGTFTFFDLLDAHELLDIQRENGRRTEQWAARNSRSSGIE